MNTYYTAKDIEDLAAKGTRQLVLNPGVFLTDFARETAHQLGIEVVRGERQTQPSSQPVSTSKNFTLNNNYNKPSGCQHVSSPIPAANSQAVNPSSHMMDGDGSKTVNRLVDLMGKVIKRGG
ncbi:MAG: hypothetical protein EHM41_07190 [Chloroflexi bacterium]|nr:MAG: hypothetical protein EHM41_07190 [Chloroflexota bacterium]